MKKHGIQPLIGIFAGSMIIQTTSLVQVVIPGMTQAFPNVPLETIQTVGTIPALIMIVAQLIVGPLSLKVPKKLILLSGLVISFIGGMLFFLLGSVVSSFSVLLIASGLIGLGNGAFAIALSAVIVDMYDGESKGQVLGVQAFFASGGTMVLLAVAGFLAKTRWSNAYAVFLIYIVIFILLLRYIPYTKPALASTEKDKDGKKPKVKLGNFGLGVWLCFIIYAFYLTGKYTHSLNYGLFIESNGLGDSVSVGLCGSIATAFGMVAGLASIYVQKYLKKYALTLGVACGATGLFIVGLSTGSLIGVYIGAAFIGFGGLTFQTSLNTQMTNLTGKALAPIALALSGICANFGVMLSPLIVNNMSRAFFGGSIQGNYYSAAIFLLLPIAITFWIIALLNKQEKKNAEAAE